MISKRYNQIIQVFEKCRKASLKCDFHLVDVPLKLQKYANEIEYNKFMNFEEIIEHVIQSHTVLEILQKTNILLLHVIQKPVIW